MEIGGLRLPQILKIDHQPNTKSKKKNYISMWKENHPYPEHNLADTSSLSLPPPAKPTTLQVFAINNSTH